ncbi:hypothetical protein [Streptomyces sp. NPDC013171]
MGGLERAELDAHPEVDWEALRQVEKDRRSPLAALLPKVKALAPA